MRKYTTHACAVCNKEFYGNPIVQTCSRTCTSELRRLNGRARRAKKQPGGVAPIYQPESDTYLIPLNHGKFAIVDAIDVDIARATWCVNTTRYAGLTYARHAEYAEGGRQIMLRMHRVILERALGRKLDPSEFVDHVDGDGLNNRRSNLRLATPSQNTANSKVRSDNRAGMKGVSKASGRGKRWKAQVYKDGVCVHRSWHNTPEEAHQTYIAESQTIFGEFANSGERKD